MHVIKVWAYLRHDGSVGKVLTESEVPADTEKKWHAETIAEAWWDEIHETGIGKKYLGYLANVIGDGRLPEWYVPARCLFLALDHLGKLDQVQQAMANLDRSWQITWEKATTFNRFHPGVAMIGKALGMSDEQLDELWSLAESL